ncbi:MAG: SAM-dependent chlorinase/fluorinase [Chloroflexia bacterium]
MPPTITLLTDFGDRGGYVGMLHGVIQTLCPGATVIDLTHAVTPQAIREGAFLLHNAYSYFPPDTIHVAVVDPGVGTERRPICLAVPGIGQFIGPDNGLFTAILETHPDTEARVIANPEYSVQRLGKEISRTFHGRDIFAPTAALLARGEPFAAVGPPIATAALTRLPNFWPEWEPVDPGQERLLGAVVHIDSFGNLITNIRRERFAAAIPEQLAEAWVTTPFHTCTGLSTTYGDHPPDSLLALFGSFNTLEIARVNSRADRGPQGQALPLGLLVEVKMWL